VYVLIGLDPSISVSDLTKTIKANSSKWINENRWFNGQFRWQEGFGSFSYSRSQIDAVAKYILNQPEHHKISTFRDEYLNLLKRPEFNK